MVMLNEPGDIRLDKTIEADAGVAPSRARTFAFLGMLLLAVLIFAAAFIYLRRDRGQTSQAAAPRPADAAVKVRQEPAEPVSLPPLDETDSLVRQLVQALSTNPVIAAWLTNDRLIVNFVVVTGRIAEGQTPAAELKSIGPIAPFRAREAKGAYIDPASYHRYDRYAQAIAALDARGAARVYDALKPRINEADRNFGGSGAFDAVLERAIAELLEVPAVDGPVALKPAGIGWAFADPSLEGMSPAQKQLLRMGPDNVRAIQKKLREIASALAIPDSRLQPSSSRQ